MNEYVNQAMVMMQKVIAAATPIAVKAWEISLLTLQIDALATIVPLTVGAIVMAVVTHKTYTWMVSMMPKWDREYCHPMSFFGPAFVIGLASVVAVLVFQLVNVWLWVKLFMPELWLAHMAIEKLVK